MVFIAYEYLANIQQKKKSKDRAEIRFGIGLGKKVRSPLQNEDFSTSQDIWTWVFSFAQHSVIKGILIEVKIMFINTSVYFWLKDGDNAKNLKSLQKAKEKCDSVDKNQLIL